MRASVWHSSKWMWMGWSQLPPSLWRFQISAVPGFGSAEMRLKSAVSPLMVQGPLIAAYMASPLASELDGAEDAHPICGWVRTLPTIDRGSVETKMTFKTERNRSVGVPTIRCVRRQPPVELALEHRTV